MLGDKIGEKVELSDHVENHPDAGAIKEFFDKNEESEKLKKIADGYYKAESKLGICSIDLAAVIGWRIARGNIEGFAALLKTNLGITDPLNSEQGRDMQMLLGKFIIEG